MIRKTMPSRTVTVRLRRKPRRSSRRMALTAIWQVTELAMRMIVAIRIRPTGSRRPWNSSGGHGVWFARVEK